MVLSNYVKKAPSKIFFQNWELFTNDMIFWKKLGELEMMLALKEGNMRGYFTYTELGILSDFVYKS